MTTAAPTATRKRSASLRSAAQELGAKWARRAVRVATVILVALLSLPPVRAWADDGAPSALSWMTINDSNGISMWAFNLSIDRGGVTEAGKFFWAIQMDTLWTLYRVTAGLGIWFLDWALAFQWLPIIANPILTVGEALTAMVDQFGLLPVLLTITAAAAGLWIMRGRWATGVWEVMVGLVIACVASGALAAPVKSLVGSDGLTYKARDTGLAIAVSLTAPEEGKAERTPEQLRTAMIASMVDTFIRKPHQLGNFGTVIDGTKCEKPYNEILKSGEGSDGSKLREAMKKCDEALGTYADNPNVLSNAGLMVLMPSGILLVALAVAIAGAIVVSGAMTVFLGLKLIVTVVLGVLPGRARAGLFQTLADLLIALGSLVLATVFLGVFMHVLQMIFEAKADKPAYALLVTTVMMIIGLVVWVTFRKRLKASAANLTRAMSFRPGGAPAPSRMPSSSAAPALAVAGSNLASRAMPTVGRAAGKASQSAAKGGARMVGSGAKLLGKGIAPDGFKAALAEDKKAIVGTGHAIAGTGQATVGLGRVMARKAGSAMGKAGLAAVTGGTSAAVTAATMASKARTTMSLARSSSPTATNSAHRTRVTGKLRTVSSEPPAGHRLAGAATQPKQRTSTSETNTTGSSPSTNQPRVQRQPPRPRTEADTARAAASVKKEQRRAESRRSRTRSEIHRASHGPTGQRLAKALAGKK